MRNMDWMGDLTKILASGVKKSMIFDEDDLCNAKKIPMLLFCKIIKLIAGNKNKLITLLGCSRWSSSRPYYHMRKKCKLFTMRARTIRENTVRYI
jgi:hypothetical protein